MKKTRKTTKLFYKAVAITPDTGDELHVNGNIHQIRAEVRAWLDLIGEPYASIHCVADDGRVLLSGVRNTAQRHFHVASAMCKCSSATEPH